MRHDFMLRTGKDLVVLCGLVFGLAGCFWEPGAKVCTNAGCLDGLDITFQEPDGEPLVADVRGTATVNGTPLSFDCSVSDASGRVTETLHLEYRCQGERLSLMWNGHVPPQVQLQLESSSSSLVFAGSPQVDYHEQFPNGPECGPRCYQGSTTVTLREP